MIVPPEGRGVVGANTSVKGTDDFPATRSDDAMTKDTYITWVITLALGTELTATPVSFDPPVTLNVPSSCCNLLPALFSATIWMEYSPEGMPKAGRLQEEA